MTAEPLTEAEWTNLSHIIARYSVHDRDASDIVAGLRSDRDFASFLRAAERERIAPLVALVRAVHERPCIDPGMDGGTCEQHNGEWSVRNGECEWSVAAREALGGPR